MTVEGLLADMRALEAEVFDAPAGRSLGAAQRWAKLYTAACRLGGESHPALAALRTGVGFDVGAVLARVYDPQHCPHT